MCWKSFSHLKWGKTKMVDKIMIEESIIKWLKSNKIKEEGKKCGLPKYDCCDILNKLMKIILMCFFFGRENESHINLSIDIRQLLSIIFVLIFNAFRFQCFIDIVECHIILVFSYDGKIAIQPVKITKCSMIFHVYLYIIHTSYTNAIGIKQFFFYILERWTLLYMYSFQMTFKPKGNKQLASSMKIESCNKHEYSTQYFAEKKYFIYIYNSAKITTRTKYIYYKIIKNSNSENVLWHHRKWFCVSIKIP